MFFNRVIPLSSFGGRRSINIIIGGKSTARNSPFPQESFFLEASSGYEKFPLLIIYNRRNGYPMKFFIFNFHRIKLKMLPFYAG